MAWSVHSLEKSGSKHITPLTHKSFPSFKKLCSNLKFRQAKYADWELTFEFKKNGLKSYVEKI